VTARRAAAARALLAGCAWSLVVGAAAGSAAQGLGLPGPGGCFEDTLEPNGYAAPTLLSGLVDRDDLNICASDDWFRVDLRADQVATLELFFEHAQGDVDVTLQDTSYRVLAVSESASDYERISWVAREDQTLLFRVYGYDGAAAGYRLRFELVDFSETCPRPDAAAATAHGALEADVVCRGRSRDYVLPVEAGEWTELLLVSDGALGDLDVRVFDEAGALLAASSGAGPAERARVFPERAGDLLVRVEGAPDGVGPFELGVARLHAVPDLWVDGTVRFERALSTAHGLKGLEEAAPAGCLVELVRVADGLPVSRSVVGEDGTFGLRASFVRPEDVRVRVSAALEAPGYTLAVSPTVDGGAWASESPTLAELGPDEDGSYAVALALDRSTPLAGALNISTVARAGLEMVRPYLRRPVHVSFIWEPGRAYPCGSCFSDGRIYLGGGEADPDEFDGPVILHELGHLLMAHMGWDDSPGGGHDGSRTWPAVAYGEGIATVIAALAAEDSLYVDGGAGSLLAYQDIDRVTSLQGYGTSDGSLLGFVSEWLTAAIGWDALDGADPDEPHDRVELGRDGVLRALFEHAVDRRRADLGPPGMELSDWVNTLRCADPRGAPALQRLVRGHMGFPFPDLGKDKCAWSGVQ
jgi:hypothetical protein